MTARTVVTGIGLVTPIGLGWRTFWEAACDGRHGITHVEAFEAAGYRPSLAGAIRGFDPAEHLPSRLIPQTDVSTQFALAASEWALQDAKLQAGAYADYDMAVVTSNAAGGFAFTHREFAKLWSRGPGTVSVYESFAWFYAVNTGQISIRNEMRGPGTAIVAEQAGGLDAIGHARRTIRLGTPLVVTGGVDSAFDPWGWISQVAGGHISAATDPSRAYRPFDADADGYVPGEGGAILVLEDQEAALARGAPASYGEIAGYASTFDPPPGSARPPGLRRAAELALTDAGVRPSEVDVVFADGAGRPDLDRIEARAIGELFGYRGVPVTVPKSLTGRLYSGGGPVDVVAALLSIKHGVIPPTAGTDAVAAEYGVDLVLRSPRPANITNALVLARGRHGFNAAIVVRKIEPREEEQ